MAQQKDTKKITVFTSTYNRAYILPKLYESLKLQTCKDFEWLVVDDGSEDETSELFDKWLEEDVIEIAYFKKKNGGKHRAINFAASKAQGQLFFIVDSDDYLTLTAVEIICKEWEKVENKKQSAGLCFRRICYNTGKMIGADFPVSPIDASSLTICYKWKIYEDKAEVFKTELIRRFPFPEIEGEKFISEAIVWNKISVCDSPLLRCVNIGIYMCEYLPDGLTANFIKLMKRNPKGGILYYKSLFNLSCIWKNPIDILKISLRLSQCIIYSFLRCFGSYL